MKTPPGCGATALQIFVIGLFLGSIQAKEKNLSSSAATTEKHPPPLLLANVWNPTIDPTGWWMSEKYDGLRAYWDGHKLWTRQGNLIHAPDYFAAELPNAIKLDGELWVARGKFEETVSIVRSEVPDDRWGRVHFMVFDAPQAKGTFEERMQFLRTTLPQGNRFVSVVAQNQCKGIPHLIAERDRIVRLGGEGLVLRQPGSTYEPRRSATLLQVKPYDDAEATVVAYEPGNGKYNGKLGSLRVRTDDGREFSIGTGLTDAQRNSPPPVGTVITYRFRGLTAKGMPRFPSFLRIRRD
jgi:DNA ligase 1